MDRPDWKKADIELVKEALRQGELRLAAQIQLATSADQRATTLAGIYVAAATGVIAALAVLEASGHPVPLILAVGGIATALAFLLGAVFCVLATLPCAIYAPGNDPSEWYGDIHQGKEPKVALGEQADHFDAHIIENRKLLAKNARRFLIGAVSGIAAPIIGLLAAALTCLFLSGGRPVF